MRGKRLLRVLWLGCALLAGCERYFPLFPPPATRPSPAPPAPLTPAPRAPQSAPRQAPAVPPPTTPPPTTPAPPAPSAPTPSTPAAPRREPAPAPAPPAPPVPPAPTPAPPATTAPPPVLSPQVGREEADRLRQEASSRLERTERLLDRLTDKRLSPQQQDTLETIQTFLLNAREALTGQDYLKAVNLAEKANVLAQELTQNVR